MNQRLQSFSQWLQEQNISFALITSTPNVFYLSGFYSDPHERLLALLVFPNSEPMLVCPQMEVSQAKRAGWQYDTLGYSDTDNPWELIYKNINARQVVPEQIAIEKSHLSLERYEQLHTYFPVRSFLNAEEKLRELRMIKDEKEIVILRQAAELADFGVDVGIKALAEGKTELDIIATIEYELKKKGVREMSFATMVLTGQKTADPHGVPGLATVQHGDFVLFDLGVVLDGYCSDITRTVVVGKATDEQKTIYETVLKAQLAAIHASRPGTEIGSIDKAARAIIEQAGYGAYFTHRVGHGLGIDVHEYPSMNATNTMPLQRGMVFTIEPGIYVPSIGGVRIEDDVFITDDGVETLTSYPKELLTI
ncbi:M24 family metallopeptidase [Thermaerobacillus caldiproteolyticus]|uniref:M24 family metallopeptidase n=1 Tax=Thermaerobacillus caldiproteolyticus TaxID=247480 RepID=UPI00188BA314|nr:Xaa-Pro peptidase family protein [Anoxybacillus caldiproteolyticus]QPA30359.1 aminopeptidase P family protein [Anoxybacillus caldiproteolyticus]